MFNPAFPWNRLPSHVRLIDGGGQDGSGEGQSGTDDDHEEDIDWKSRFEEELRHSRDWEKKAKANKAAADELEQLKESRMSEAEKTAKRISDLEAENNAYKLRQQHEEWARAVSEETGVPVSLLHGDSEEEMRAYAKQLDQWAHPKPKGMPNQGGKPDGQSKHAQEIAWANSLFENAGK